MEIGQRIKFLRESQKIKQINLAKYLEVDSASISRIESGKGNPTNEQLIKIAEFFKVTTDYILTGKESEGTLSEKEAELIKAAREDNAIMNALSDFVEAKKKVLIRLSTLSQQHAYN